MEKGPSDWESESIWAPSVIKNEHTYEMWYRGNSEDGRGFGYASFISGGTDLHYSGQIMIFPNPTDGLINIRFTEPGECVVEIASLNGQVIYSGKMEGPSHQLDLSSFQDGVYFIRVLSRNRVWTEKIINL